MPDPESAPGCATVSVDGLVQHHGGQSQPGVFLDVNGQPSLQLLGLLGSLGGAGEIRPSA